MAANKQDAMKALEEELENAGNPILDISKSSIKFQSKGKVMRYHLPGENPKKVRVETQMDDDGEKTWVPTVSINISSL